jgi:pyruvate dehydrogenase E1 component alpha subunit
MQSVRISTTFGQHQDSTERDKNPLSRPIRHVNATPRHQREIAMSLDSSQMKTLYRNLVRANRFDEMMYRRITSGQLIGFFHPGEGAMAPGVAAASFLEQGDILNPHHRGHGMGHMLSRGVDLKTYLAEHTGKETGCNKGRSSFHWSYPEYGIHMTTGFIGLTFTPSVGWAWACKRRGKNRITMMCSGDGSYGQGRAHEAMTCAANWNLPLIFWCENNGMAIHSTAEDMHPMPDISSLAAGYGIPAMIVDGQDVFACAEAALAAIDRARQGKGPTFVECKVLRFKEHDVGTPDLAGYQLRPEELHAEMRRREPEALATERLLAEKIFSQDEIDAIVEEALAEVAAAEKFADESPVATPSEEELMAAVYAP